MIVRFETASFKSVLKALGNPSDLKITLAHSKWFEVLLAENCLKKIQKSGITHQIKPHIAALEDERRS